MTLNVYAPPLASFDELPACSADARFYVVSSRKMLLLFFLTMGWYGYFSDYMNWRRYRHATGANVWPLARAAFDFIFVFYLYRNIGNYDPSGTRQRWDCRAAAAAFALLLLVEIVLSALARRDIGTPFLEFATFLILIPTALIRNKAQQEINARSGDPTASSNDNFSTINLSWCIAGLLLWGWCFSSYFIES